MKQWCLMPNPHDRHDNCFGVVECDLDRDPCQRCVDMSRGASFRDLPWCSRRLPRTIVGTEQHEFVGRNSVWCQGVLGYEAGHERYGEVCEAPRDAKIHQKPTGPNYTWTYETKDSGKREEFASGMKRDTQEGKPRFDLIPRLMLRRVAELATRGAIKYGEHNWGLASSRDELIRFRAAAIRHMFQWADGDRTEDHAAAAIWNIMAYEEILSRIAGAVDTLYDFRDPRLPERFWDKIDIDDKGCWVWNAARSQAGYGMIAWEGSTRTAHGLCWEAYEGSVAEGFELDHLCHNRACCSPYHLESVTHQENMRRGRSTITGSCRAGHPKAKVGERCLTCARIASGWKGNPPSGERMNCPQGHPYDGTNTWIEPSTGRRRCKICKLEAQRRYRGKTDESGEDDE